MSKPVIAPIRASFQALARCLVPETRQLDSEGWRAAEELIEVALAARPKSIRRELQLFVVAAAWSPLLRYGRIFGSLSPARQTAFLLSLQHAPILPVRRGVWGLRTMVLMGYYGQESVRRNIGYRADPRGWSGSAYRLDRGPLAKVAEPVSDG